MAITVNQIAQQCGVSRTTVLRALNGGSVAKETKERILQVARDNNYRPNLLARSLNHGRTMSLGVVTINIENMYFVQSLNTINKEADKRGYFTNIVVCDESLEWEKKLIQGLAERQMEGIMINPLNKGKDFGLMGFDDISVLQYISPKLTTVSTNVEGVASTAVVELIQQIESDGYTPKSIYLNYQILDRDTL